MRFNDAIVIKTTLLKRKYLANLETGEVIDANETALAIVKIVRDKRVISVEEMLGKLCEEYDAQPEQIRGDVEETITQLIAMNVFIA